MIKAIFNKAARYYTQLTLKFRFDKECKFCREDIQKLNDEGYQVPYGKVIILRPTFNASNVFECFHVEIADDPARKRGH